MRPTLYGVLEDTRDAAAELRADALPLSPDVDAKLTRFESAVTHALLSSPDGQNIAHPEEMVALDALCELHLALRDAREPLRARFRPIVETWISYAVTTGMTPQEMEARSADSPVDAWFESPDGATG